ncbi:MAG: hypothetical protein J6Q55_00080 [Clostridia bacterium]|nr:hypothetical protein [Clostridia bacterium]
MLQAPSSVYPESFAGVEGYLLAKLPRGTAFDQLFNGYSKISDDTFDYYYLSVPTEDTPLEDSPSDSEPTGTEEQEPTVEIISDVPLYVGIGIATLVLILGCVLVVVLKKNSPKK